ncbi:c-type cytochrome [Tropicimonas sediminicola]|uniref:Cytochrome c n=1 Tax=Tropicimonas sediminicola TaxID=1031541 RepID=A0A239FF25_9RHOB|nr:cytochrome c [Tropicimonas sediminicola]SNS55526.1 Cytochrome c [Tropicimonas sediminicola]
MTRTLNLVSVLLAMTAFAIQPAAAETVGQDEYMNSCAQCHGAGGKGDGPMVGFLTGTMPDLTTLAAENGGVFPITRVYSMIQGAAEPGAHGTREMPIWGNRYRVQGEAAGNPDFSLSEAETYARFRILALVEYLSTIQAE